MSWQTDLKSLKPNVYQSKTTSDLLTLIEQLNNENDKLNQENQQLNNENQRLHQQLTAFPT